MGGGTILQARWRHRQSTDADLFCEPATYANAVRQHGRAIEAEIRKIADRHEDTAPFVDQVATFSRIDQTEVTILPAIALIGTRTGRFVPHTTIETESSADILAGKLVHRLCGAGVVEPRDLFDLLAAEHHDPLALRQAVGLLSDIQRDEISATLLMLPRKWASVSEKRVLLISGNHRDVDPSAVVELLRRFAAPERSSSPSQPG